MRQLHLRILLFGLLQTAFNIADRIQIFAQLRAVPRTQTGLQSVNPASNVIKNAALLLHPCQPRCRIIGSALAKQTLENFRLFGAPHVAIITSEPGLGVYGAVDVGGYVQVLMLAMKAHGVGSIAQAALASHSALAKSLLGIPQERLMVCGISFGYEDKDHIANSYRLGRADISEAVTWVKD